MASTTDPDVCVDPDFVALRNHRRGFPTPSPSAGQQAGSQPYSKKIGLHVRFESDRVSAKDPKAASMSSTTESSVYIDPIGFLGPLARPVLNHAITATGLNSPTANPHPHRSRSSIAAFLDHDNDNAHRADNANPWNFPKLLPSTTQAAMNIIQTDARGRALTKRQLGAIRKIVCCPSKCETEGLSKPIRPPSHQLILDIAPLGSNYAPSEVSEDPSHRKAKSAWNYPKLEARSQKLVSRPNIGEKRKSKVQKRESDVDVMPEFLGGFGDFESAHSEPEVVLEPAPKPQKKQKGKKGKQDAGQNNPQAQQSAKQSKKQLKKLVQQEPLDEEFHASQLYGEYNADASTERAQLPTELEVQQSPTPSAKFAGWDMAPQEPPPEQRTEGSRRSKYSHQGSHKSASVQEELEDDWGVLELPEGKVSNREAKSSKRSGHSYHGSPKAESSRLHHSQHESQKVKSPRHSSRHHEAQKTLSIAAGSVAWGEPEGIAGAGAEMWVGNPAASLQGSHKDSDRHSKKTTSRHSGSRRSNMFAGDLPLHTIFEDAPSESMKQSSSRRGQAVKSGGRLSRSNEEFDVLDLNEKPASRHSSGSRRSHDLQSRPGDNVDNWDMIEKPASKHGSGSGRSGGHQSRTGEVVDGWAQQEQPSSKHGSTRNGSHRSRTADVLDGWGQPEKPSPKQGSHQSDGHRSRLSEATDHYDPPEKPASRQGSHGSNSNHIRHSEAIDDWDQPDKPVSRPGSHSKIGGRQSRQSSATDYWDQPEKSSSKHGSKSSSRVSRHNKDDVGDGGWDSSDRVVSRQASVAGGSQAGWDTKASSDTQSKADQGWGDDDGAPSKHGSGSGSHRNESLKSSSRSNHYEEQEDGRDSRHRSHRSGSGSHKKPSDPRASVSRSPSKKGTIASSYLAPLVEDDPENWHGWDGDGDKSRRKSRSHKSHSEAAVDEWIQGSIKAGSSKSSPVKEHNSPAMALSIGSTVTSTTSIDPHAPSLRNDPIESWAAGRVPRDSSVGTRFGRDPPVGSGFGAQPGSAAGWSQSGRVEGETGMGSRMSGSWTSSRGIREAAEQGGWATQTSDGSHQSSHRPGSAREERVGSGWDTRTCSSLEASKVSSRQSHRGEPSSREDSRASSRRSSSHRSGPENWSQSGRLEGETGKGSRRSSQQSSRQSSRQHEVAPVDDGGWNTQTSSSQERDSHNSKRSSSIRRDVSPAFDNDVQGGGWKNSVRSSRHSAGSRRSRASTAQDDGGWGELAQQGDWGVDADAPQNAAGGWAGGDERNSNLSKKSGSRGSKGSKRSGDISKSFF
ncbi:hypothetical protein E6O75_ATG02268 [Venturia nashicola]|uniref:Uncharacterized protein n=1 Tax=Venturia nashicola TaxID=86259 RepID=A0A4Z1PLZ7_9PEZI|nr:hypothetical protein E6O75_ATG02268 [Venturia nashicola]